MKKLILLLLLIIIIVVGAIGALFAFKNTIAENALQSSFEAISGLPVEVSGVEVSEMGKKVNVGSITIRNPSGFFSKNLALVSKIEMACDPKAFLLSRKVACSHVKAHLDKIFVDRTKDGKVNLREITALKQDVVASAAEQAIGSSFMIERLEVFYGTVNVVEASSSGNKASEVALGKGKEIYGFLADQSTLIYIPVVKTLSALNRGSLGIPRHMLQKRIIDTTGKR